MDRDAEWKPKGELPVSSHMLLIYASQVAIKCLRDQQVRKEKAKKVSTYLDLYLVLT
jgi:hypothetical protein